MGFLCYGSWCYAYVSYGVNFGPFKGVPPFIVFVFLSIIKLKKVSQNLMLHFF